MPPTEEEQPEDNPDDTDNQGNAFSEPYECVEEKETELEQHVEAERDALSASTVEVRSSKPDSAQCDASHCPMDERKAKSLSAVLYRFLTNRNIEDSFMLYRDDRTEQ